MKEYIMRYENEVLQLLPDKMQELVRCKDCANSEHWYGDKSRCFLWNETGIDVFNDGFCNYGERKCKEGAVKTDA